MVEGAPLLRAYGSKAHRGFESLSLRHTLGELSAAWIREWRGRRSGDNAPEGGPKGEERMRRVIPPSPPWIRFSLVRARSSVG